VTGDRDSRYDDHLLHGNATQPSTGLLFDRSGRVLGNDFLSFKRLNFYFSLTGLERTIRYFNCCLAHPVVKHETIKSDFCSE